MTESRKDSEGEMVREREQGGERKGGSEREKQGVMYRGNPVRLLDFSAETLQARKE